MDIVVEPLIRRNPEPLQRRRGVRQLGDLLGEVGRSAEFVQPCLCRQRMVEMGARDARALGVAATERGRAVDTGGVERAAVPAPPGKATDPSSTSLQDFLYGMDFPE